MHPIHILILLMAFGGGVLLGQIITILILENWHD